MQFAIKGENKMHPGSMIRKEEVQWEDLIHSNYAKSIKNDLSKKFPQYDFHFSGVENSYRNPLILQVACGLSDLEFHTVLGYAMCLNDLLSKNII